jgi:hypothetical protein
MTSRPAAKFAAERIVMLCVEREQVEQMLRPIGSGSSPPFSSKAKEADLREVTPGRRAELTDRIADYDRLIARWSADLDERELGPAV